jgi:hypothetical protein
MNPKMLERFVRRDYEVLIGVASTRSPLARGIDLPERIRYVIFAGVPRRELLVSWNEYKPCPRWRWDLRWGGGWGLAGLTQPLARQPFVPGGVGWALYLDDTVSRVQRTELISSLSLASSL